jgi:hypothetical protein
MHRDGVTRQEFVRLYNEKNEKSRTLNIEELVLKHDSYPPIRPRARPPLRARVCVRESMGMRDRVQCSFCEVTSNLYVTSGDRLRRLSGRSLNAASVVMQELKSGQDLYVVTNATVARGNFLAHTLPYMLNRARPDPKP